MAKTQATVKATFVKKGKAVVKARKLKQLNKQMSWAKKAGRKAGAAAKKMMRAAKKLKGVAKRKKMKAAKVEMFAKKSAAKLVARIKKRTRVVRKMK